MQEGVFPLTTFDFVRHPALREVVGHWRSLVRDGRAPDRRELDPGRMKDALPYVWLCQKEGPGQYRMRLAGAEINALLQQPLRGRALHEVLSETEWQDAEPRFEQVISLPAVLWSAGALFESEPEGPLGECVMLPVEDRQHVTLVLGATVHGLEHVRRRGRLLAGESKVVEVVKLSDL